MPYYNLIFGASVLICSLIGSAAGLLVKRISHRMNDIFLGFAAGVMLAAAFIGLLPQAFEGIKGINIALNIGGILLGGLSISLIDKFMPHTHFHDGDFKESEGAKKSRSNINRVMLIVIAIAIHNIPEGLAVGLALGQGREGLTVLISIMIQKIPEGLIVALPLIAIGMKKSKVLLYSVVVALMMLPGILIGVLFGYMPIELNSFFTAFTFGAIIYVVSDEIIPESHEHGFQRAATFSLIVGILLVALIDIFI